MGNAARLVMKRLAKAQATSQVINLSNAAQDSHVAILRAISAIEGLEENNPQIREMKEYQSVLQALHDAQPLALKLSALADKAADEVKHLDFFVT